MHTAWVGPSVNVDGGMAEGGPLAPGTVCWRLRGGGGVSYALSPGGSNSASCCAGAPMHGRRDWLRVCGRVLAAGFGGQWPGFDF